MKTLSIVLCLCLALPLTAQQAPAKQPSTPSPEAALRSELAQKDVQIAQLNAQLHELQLEVQLYEATTGVTARRAADQKAVQDAADAASKAEKKP